MPEPPRVLPASQFVPRPIDWLWPQYFSTGNLALLEGDPGLGKSLVALDLCARLSTGRPWPDGKPGDGAGTSLVVNAEDVPEDMIRPRLEALGADLDRVFLWDRGGELPCLPSRLGVFEKVLSEVRPRLVVLDPILAFLEKGGNSHHAVRRALDPLACLALRYGCVILLILHLNKAAGWASPLYRGCGSIAFVAACRSAWLVGKDRQQGDRCVLAQVKNNQAQEQPSLAYSVSGAGAGAPTLTWLGVSASSATELLRGAPAVAPLCPRDRARDFILDFLRAGPQRARAVWLAAQKQGLTKRTLDRVKRDLDIRSLRVWEDGVFRSYWLLPGQEVPQTDPTDDPYSLEPWLAPLREKYPPSTPLDEV